MPDIEEDSDEEGFHRSGAKSKKNKPLAITNQSESDSMPELQSVSNTDDDDDDDDEDSDDFDDGGSSDDDSGYNTEEEDEIREKLREAMDAAHEADWFDDSAPGIDPFLQDDRKANPFLNLLGSLRGMQFLFIIHFLCQSLTSSDRENVFFQSQIEDYNPNRTPSPSSPRRIQGDTKRGPEGGPKNNASQTSSSARCTSRHSFTRTR